MREKRDGKRRYIIEKSTLYCNLADSTTIVYLLAAGSPDITLAGDRGSARGSCVHDNVTRPFNKRVTLSSCSLP